MKKIVNIVINKEIEVEEQVKKVDENNKEITILQKVKKNEPHTFILTKPTRQLKEDAELFYNGIYWECIRNGIMPVSQMQKRYLNDNGVLSEEQKKAYESLYEELFEAQAEQISLKNKTEKTEEDKKKEAEIFNKIVEIFSQIQEFESKAIDVMYQNTAENIAKNRTAVWWMLYLAYEDLGNNKFAPVFKGESYKDKLASYDSILEDENSFNGELIQKLLLISSLWYFGKAENQEQFDIALKVVENKGLIDTLDMVKS